MGLLQGLMGHATQCSIEEIQKEFEPILIPDEKVERAYKLIRDQMVFTNKRFILVDKQGITAKKVEYLSIPYRNIVCFAKESAGIMDLDAELKLWIARKAEPITLEFSKDGDINEVYTVLSQYVLD